MTDVKLPVVTEQTLEGIFEAVGDTRQIADSALVAEWYQTMLKENPTLTREVEIHSNALPAADRNAAFYMATLMYMILRAQLASDNATL